MQVILQATIPELGVFSGGNMLVTSHTVAFRFIEKRVILRKTQ